MKVTYRKASKRRKRNPSLLSLVNPAKKKAATAKAKPPTAAKVKATAKKAAKDAVKTAVKAAVKAEVKKAVKAVKAQKIPKSRVQTIGKRDYRVFGQPSREPARPHWPPDTGYYRPAVRAPGDPDNIAYSYTHPQTGKKIDVDYLRRPAGWYATQGYSFTPKKGKNKGKTISVSPSWRYVRNEEKKMARRKTRRTRKNTARKAPVRRAPKRSTARKTPKRKPRVLVLSGLRAPKKRRGAKRNASRGMRRLALRRPRRNPIRGKKRTRRAHRNPATGAKWLKFGLAGFGGYLVGRIVANVIQQNAATLPPGVGQFGALLGTAGGAVLAYFASKKIKALQPYQTPIVIGAIISVADVLLDSIATQLPAGGYLARVQSAPLLPAATGVGGWQGTSSYWGDTGGQPVSLTARALSEYVREPAALGEYIATGMGADPHGLDAGVIRGGLFGEPGDDGDFDIVLDD